MAAFDNIPFDDSLAGAPSPIDPNSKFADFDSSNLEALGQEQAPSPDGAASQGALGAPSPDGETSADGPAALGDEGPQDMLSIFNQSTEDSRNHLLNEVQESYAPLGYSVEGAMDNALMKGGPHAMARAAQFGIDLTPFANKINPDGADKKTGQAFGNIPSDEQAGQPGFKSADQATSDFQAGVADTKEGIRVEKLAQRQAIAAFLIEAGLRTIASERDAGAAMAEGALGTMDARRERKRTADQDSIAAQQRERTNRRQDEQDEAGKLRAQQETETYEYEKSQRGAAEDKATRAGMQEVVNEEGEVYYFDPINPEGGKWVVDAEGNRVKSADVGLSKAQIATNARAYQSQMNGKVEKIKGMDDWERKKMYPSTEDLDGDALVNEIIRLAREEIDNQAGQSSASDEIDYATM